MSKDFGLTWHLATTYVVQFDWAPLPNATTIRRTLPHSEAMAKVVDPTPSSDGIDYRLFFL